MPKGPFLVLFRQYFFVRVVESTLHHFSLLSRCYFFFDLSQSFTILLSLSYLYFPFVDESTVLFFMAESFLLFKNFVPSPVAGTLKKIVIE